MERFESNTFIYFVSYLKGPIKIGKTRDLKKRIASLQTAHPYPLEVLGFLQTGDETLEGVLHQKFSRYKLNGEWFDRSDEILHYIRDNCQPKATKESEDIFYREVLEPGDYGLVVVDDVESEFHGKVGFYDDDEFEEEFTCERCETEPVEGCEECHIVQLAIVYFQPYLNGSYYLLCHESLRKIDEEVEPDLALRATRGIFPNLKLDELKMVMETASPEAPYYDALIKERSRRLSLGIDDSQGESRCKDDHKKPLTVDNQGGNVDESSRDL